MTCHIQNRIKIREKQGGRCCYCLQPMVLSDKPPHKQPRNAETLEHPRCRSDGGRNNRDNIALACKRCNEERRGMDWLLYTSYRRGEIWELIECAPPCAHRRGS
ncbi:HNH endonuclease [Rhizobium indicum]|uniref:HNH endonuclease n=2 Tax=Rhizobium TaxID=379 RepID=UPI001106CB75|nr:HNH endonuclease [Rhizobium sp. WYCCWR 11152]QKK29149.1 HNH endonuclease [Rhizobium indicum]